MNSLFNSFHGLFHPLHHLFLKFFVLLFNHFATVPHFFHQSLVFISQLWYFVSQLLIQKPQLVNSIPVTLFVDFFLIDFVMETLNLVFQWLDLPLILRTLFYQGRTLGAWLFQGLLQPKLNLSIKIPLNLWFKLLQRLTLQIFLLWQTGLMILPSRLFGVLLSRTLNYH